MLSVLLGVIRRWNATRPPADAEHDRPEQSTATRVELSARRRVDAYDTVARTVFGLSPSTQHNRCRS
eukprot:5678018-Pleurochrysis_carterae.AAC.1